MVPSLGHNHVWSLNESFLRFVPTFSFAVRVVSAIILLLRKLNWLNCSRLPWRYHCDPLMVFLMFRIILQLCVWRVAVRWLHKHWGLSSSSERAWCSRRNAINAKKKRGTFMCCVRMHLCSRHAFQQIRDHSGWHTFVVNGSYNGALGQRGTWMNSFLSHLSYNMLRYVILNCTGA